MSVSGKASEVEDAGSEGSFARAIRWRTDQWDRLEAATQRLSDQIHIDVSVTDFIRSAALKRADEVLAA